MRAGRKLRPPLLPGATLEEFFAFVAAVDRSIYDPWWNTAAADQAAAAWKERRSRS